MVGKGTRKGAQKRVNRGGDMDERGRTDRLTGDESAHDRLIACVVCYAALEMMRDPCTDETCS